MKYEVVRRIWKNKPGFKDTNLKAIETCFSFPTRIQANAAREEMEKKNEKENVDYIVIECF